MCPKVIKLMILTIQLFKEFKQKKIIVKIIGLLNLDRILIEVEVLQYLETDKRLYNS